MTPTRRGMVGGITAYVSWGLFPLYWPLLKPAGALEILANRMIWSLIAVSLYLTVRRNWQWFPHLIRQRKRLALLAAAAVAVSINWGTYIYGVNSGHTIESALGYFINPLVTVVFGLVVFREHLRPAQWAAVGLALVAVVVLTADYGRPPWIALTLACSFGLYGLLKKFANTASAEGLTIETMVLATPALTFLLILQSTGHGTFANHGSAHTAGLIGAGVITALPLLAFNMAATSLPMVTLGMLQYLTPILQFIIGLTVQHEAMPTSRWIGFGIVWIALIVLTADALRGNRKRAATRSVPPAVAQPAATADQPQC